KIPYELRFKGRLMLAYQGYKVTEQTNHLTNVHATQNTNSNRLADFSQLEVKRLNLIFAGSVYDPDLKYNFNILATTRGLGGLQNNKVIQNSPTGGAAPNGSS